MYYHGNQIIRIPHKLQNAVNRRVAIFWQEAQNSWETVSDQKQEAPYIEYLQKEKKNIFISLKDS